MTESEEELKSLLMRVKEESERASLKLNIKKKIKLRSWHSTPLLLLLLLGRFSHVWLFATLWTAAHQASLSITNSRSLLKLMSIASVMPSNHLILCHPLFLLPSIFPSIRFFSTELVLRLSWPKYWSFIISPSNEYSGLISFRIDWLDLLSLRPISSNP